MTASKYNAMQWKSKTTLFNEITEFIIAFNLILREQTKINQEFKFYKQHRIHKKTSVIQSLYVTIRFPKVSFVCAYFRFLNMYIVYSLLRKHIFTIGSNRSH